MGAYGVRLWSLVLWGLVLEESRLLFIMIITRVVIHDNDGKRYVVNHDKDSKYIYLHVCKFNKETF